MSQNRTIRRTGLARAISKLGYCSRSSAKLLIEQGRVRIKGRVVTNPETPVRLGHDQIEVSGKRLEETKRAYVMLNKPRGIVTTAQDEKGRETVYSLLTNQEWLAPVGRLDKASEGLLLLTNDSDWAERILSPRNHLSKTYHVQIDCVADDDLLGRLISGVPAEDGVLLKAKRVNLLRVGEKNCWLEIVLDEGKNRQIRRMLSAFRIEVLRLVRVAIGPLELGNLAKGDLRELTSGEVRSLNQASFSRQNVRGLRKKC